MKSLVWRTFKVPQSYVSSCSCSVYSSLVIDYSFIAFLYQAFYTLTRCMHQFKIKTKLGEIPFPISGVLSPHSSLLSSTRCYYSLPYLELCLLKPARILFSAKESPSQLSIQEYISSQKAKAIIGLISFLSFILGPQSIFVLIFYQFFQLNFFQVK